MNNQRIDLPEVTEVLNLINNPPNIHDHFLPGDLEGNFDSWFDGGAVNRITGYNIYQLKNGTQITLFVLPRLLLTIKFPNGEVIHISSE